METCTSEEPKVKVMDESCREQKVDISINLEVPETPSDTHDPQSPIEEPIKID